MWGGSGAGVGWGVVHTAQLGNWREKSMEEEEEVEVGEGMKAGMEWDTNGGNEVHFHL